jgi:hypothetical protein
MAASANFVDKLYTGQQRSYNQKKFLSYQCWYLAEKAALVAHIRDPEVPKLTFFPDPVPDSYCLIKSSF